MPHRAGLILGQIVRSLKGIKCKAKGEGRFWNWLVHKTKLNKICTKRNKCIRSMLFDHGREHVNPFYILLGISQEIDPASFSLAGDFDIGRCHLPWPTILENLDTRLRHCGQTFRSFCFSRPTLRAKEIPLVRLLSHLFLVEVLSCQIYAFSDRVRHVLVEVLDLCVH